MEGEGLCYKVSCSGILTVIFPVLLFSSLSARASNTVEPFMSFPE